MKLILRPLSHPQLDELTLEKGVLAIGRSEAPFTALSEHIRSKLSRRHARIFEENGSVFLVELGSLNGSKLNGQTIETPVKLRPGDEIRFANRFVFGVDILGEVDCGPTRRLLLPTMNLMPEHEDAGVDPIQVSRFPFLVGTRDDVFSRYKEAFPEAIRHISRRHAVIYTCSGDFHLEDLNSKFGTFVSDSRLSEQAKVLHDGDSVTFGTMPFSYTVQLEQAKDTTSGGTGAPEDTVLRKGETPGKESVTMYVDKAGSFLDIFCAQDEPEQSPDSISRFPQQEKQEQSSKAQGKSVSRTQPGAFRRFTIFLIDLKRAFSPERRSHSKRSWFAAGATVLLLAATRPFLRGSNRYKDHV